MQVAQIGNLHISGIIMGTYSHRIIFTMFGISIALIFINSLISSKQISNENTLNYSSGDKIKISDSASNLDTGNAEYKSNAELVEYNAVSEAYGSIYTLKSVKIKNNTDVTLKDFKVRCDISGMSGTRLGELDVTIYDIVKPKKTRTFENIHVGFMPRGGGRSGCRLSSWEIY
jgi:hypothetical protein